MDQKRFDALKRKYDAVLKAIQQQGVSLTHLHEDEGKLVMTGRAPSDAAKNRIWDKIKEIDPAYQDLAVDFTVDTSMAPAPAASGSDNHHGEEHIYTVQAGDTLSKISKQFYGETSLYMSIFEANRDQLSDPNKIQTGMRLRIPSSGKQVVS
jgi:nucleoid-associated protein YgaU